MVLSGGFVGADMGKRVVLLRGVCANREQLRVWVYVTATLWCIFIQLRGHVHGPGPSTRSTCEPQEASFCSSNLP